ncbi:metal-binding protein [Pseudoflavitalea sp. G-6-1-2]|uniref:Ada metal-binding domain-containing protein n=1 Tax=Pseudoflavitalea sp. G-6-1-2 TaxID=2728841 RepID=UPI00146A11C6|nr:Ada metal-binding domain-containing protein [Pseudoflavitalea sp. G-6-1-2]NML20282.1 metal-binding protein [Pseudoflavitalea sp. G-6-1-2]
MIAHLTLGNTNFERSRQLKKLIDEGKIRLGGNKNLKIYGTLQCKSGMKMKTANRVFFQSEKEATEAGYRPCGHCMRQGYLVWKTGGARLRHK